MEGGLETGTVAGVAAVIVLVGRASLGSRDDGGGSGGGSSSKTTPSTLTTAKVRVLLEPIGVRCFRNTLNRRWLCMMGGLKL